MQINTIIYYTKNIQLLYSKPLIKNKCQQVTEY